MFRVLFDPFFLSFRVKQEWGEVGGGYMVEDREGKNCYSPENTKKKEEKKLDRPPYLNNWFKSKKERTRNPFLSIYSRRRNVTKRNETI